MRSRAGAVTLNAMATTEHAAAAAAGSPSKEGESLQQQQRARHDFDAAVAPLEAKARRRLLGKNRELCFAAFIEDRNGCLALVDDAFARARINPLGLLVKMVAAGEHLHGAPPSMEEARALRAQAGMPAPTESSAYRGVSHADIERIGAELPDKPDELEPTERCSVCGYGGNVPHLADCERAPGSRNRRETAE